jgi:hypothetical protein
MGPATGPQHERNEPVSPKRPSKPLSLTFRLRLSKVFQQLEAAVREAEERSWEQIDRERASEISLALAGACRVGGFKEVATAARSLGCLMKLSREQIQPIDAAFREKVHEIMTFLRSEADRALTGT